MPITKVTCTDYDEPNDEFVFKVEKDGQQPETKKITGYELTELEDQPIVSLKSEEIAIFCLYRRHFFEDPHELLNKSFEL